MLKTLCGVGVRPVEMTQAYIGRKSEMLRFTILQIDRIFVWVGISLEICEHIYKDELL